MRKRKHAKAHQYILIPCKATETNSRYVAEAEHLLFRFIPYPFEFEYNCTPLFIRNRIIRYALQRGIESVALHKLHFFLVC